uniref:4Fe-4S Wbl-type domain-containing protein n=1 Tax=Streptomyces sp. NBC_00003 TaxID=2903608 RepID=A0AAU2VB63_9ACTN
MTSRSGRYYSTTEIKYPQPPVTLDIDRWLYAYEEHPECGVCVANAKECRTALKQGRHRDAFEAAAEIRNGHPEHPRAAE